MKRGWILCTLGWSIIAGSATVEDSFRNVDCKNFASRQLVGKHTPSIDIVPFSDRENRRDVINFGGSLLSNQHFAVEFWKICGQDLWLLTELNEKSSIVRDVQPVPTHLKNEVTYTGICQFRGRAVDDVVALLRYDFLEKDLPAIESWSVDLASKKFRKQEAEGLSCPNKAYGL